MGNWRDQVLREFVPNVAQLTLVADPDGLLWEEDILAGIHQRGFDLIPFGDPIAFRYDYESKFRSRWDRGERAELVVVLNGAANELDRLPCDLLQAGRRLSFSLGDIFPTLSYPIIAALDRRCLDPLHDAQVRFNPGMLGDNATQDFILRHVFEIVPESIGKQSELLRVLLRRHHRNQQISATLDEHWVRILRQRTGFDDWPLEKIIPDREAFFRFLQERWPIFLDRSAAHVGVGIRENGEAYGLEFPGPSVLPFDDDDVRVYVDSLFMEGFLEAVPHAQAESLSTTWFAVGIRSDDQADRTRRIDTLLDTLTSIIPQPDARHSEWFRLARTWAELLVLAHDSDAMVPEPTRQSMENLHSQFDAALMTWLAKRYAGLVNLPPVPPVMLHHVPRFLSRHVHAARDHKVALVVLDGLSLAQWLVIRKELAGQRPAYRFREDAVFAWIPTLTSVSRQAAFAGRPPAYFPDSIHRTNKEPALWTQFWVDEGLTRQEVAYCKGLGDGALDNVEEIIVRPKTRAVGLVVDKVDRIMHGMELGTAGMHSQVRLWAGQPFMASLVDLLLENGFRICLTSDHGNIEASGRGRPGEGSKADVRGERARIYRNALLRSQVKAQFPDAVEWPTIGLPDDYLPLLASGRSAFVGETQHLVGHGGASIEELVVPLVQIERTDA